MKKTRQLLLMTAAVAGMAGLTGCRNTSGTAVTTDLQTGTSMIDASNARLAHRVRVVHTAYDEVNGLKRVHLTLQSNRNRRLRVDYRICWYNAAGMEIDSQAQSYHTLILEGRDQVTVSGVAGSADAVASRLRLRETSQAE